MAPDADAFAECLIKLLISGNCTDEVELAAAKSIFGEFTSAYMAHDWMGLRLRDGRHVVFRAAALASVAAQ